MITNVETFKHFCNVKKLRQVYSRHSCEKPLIKGGFVKLGYKDLFRCGTGKIM